MKVAAGMRFHRWLVMYKAPAKAGEVGRHLKWRCRCDCGQIRDVFQGNLTRGLSQSCGCLTREVNSAQKFKHGKPPEFNCWASMKQRCSNPALRSYKDYGGRGITVCERWRDSFLAFLEDMGKRPSPDHSIERIDVNGNYEPSNCRWATRKEQGRNKRTTRKVGGLPITAVAEQVGVVAATVRGRLDRGWSDADAVGRAVASRPPIELEFGAVFGALTVVAEIDNPRAKAQKRHHYLVRCACSKYKVIRASRLIAGQAIACSRYCRFRQKAG